MEPTQSPINEIVGTQEPKWRVSLRLIIELNNRNKTSLIGPTTQGTRKKRESMLMGMFLTLRKKLNFMIDDPASIKPKHVEALVKYWISNEMTPRAIDLHLSVLRTFTGWIGKDGMVKSLETYAPNLRKTKNREFKFKATINDSDNCSEHAVSFWDIFDRIYREDRAVAAQFMLVAVFGAKRGEAINFKPLKNTKDDFIELDENSKGSRTRRIPVDSVFKVAVLSMLKNHVLVNGNWDNGKLSNPDKTDLQNIKRYTNVLSKLGVTKNLSGKNWIGGGEEFNVAELEKRGLIASLKSSVN